MALILDTGVTQVLSVPQFSSYTSQLPLEQLQWAFVERHATSGWRLHCCNQGTKVASRRQCEHQGALDTESCSLKNQKLHGIILHPLRSRSPHITYILSS